MKDGQTQTTDPLEADLAYLEREQRAFQNHWIWDRLRCRPEEFFLAFRRHLDSLNIPKAQWERAYQKAREELATQARERQRGQKTFQLQMLSGLRA